MRTADDIKNSMRAAAGAGIVFPTRIGRLEINYCHVLRALDNDRPKAGFQFGLNSQGL